jgi:serine/threonine-protein kinase
VHGQSVRHLLEIQGRLTEGEAVRYGIQVGTALQYAHGQGVIHCDVKPENILVDENGVAKVADFGVAETANRTLRPDEVRDILGTIAYLAPEVIQGAAADPRSDVYSLALTVYEMVAGRLPFTGTNPAAVAGQRLGSAPPPLRTFAISASPELEASGRGLAPFPSLLDMRTIAALAGSGRGQARLRPAAHPGASAGRSAPSPAANGSREEKRRRGPPGPLPTPGRS